MAVDTRNKRASVFGVGLVAALILPSPDAAVSQPDRQHVAFTYAGIAAGAPSFLPDVVTTRTRSLVDVRTTRSLVKVRRTKAVDGD